MPTSPAGSASTGRSHRPTLQRSTLGLVAGGPDRLAPRGRLLRRLLEVPPGCAVAVWAPPGYGKTTLLTQWSRAVDRPVVWLQLTAEHDDPAALLAALIEVWDPVEPLPGFVTELTEVTGPRPEGLLAARLTRALHRAQVPKVVVLDDLHILRDPGTVEIVAGLVEGMPAHSTLAVASRSEPPAPLRLLATDGRLMEVTDGDLRLSVTDARDVFRSWGHEPDHDDLAELVEHCDGWPVVVSILARPPARRPAMGPARQDIAWRLDASADSTVRSFVRDAVLGGVTAADADFMVRSAVLSELTGEECDAVLGETDSTVRLRRLAAARLLVAPAAAAGARQPRYRYHALLLDVLQDELALRPRDEVRTLHERAARWYARQGDLGTAMHHAGRVGSPELAGALLWPHLPDVLGHGRLASLQRWLDGLPPGMVRQSVELTVAAAWAAVQAGDMVRMLDHLMTARALAPEHGPMAGHVAILDAMAGHDGVAAMLERARFAQAEDLPDSPWRCLAWQLQGLALRVMGRDREAEEAFERGDLIARAKDIPATQAHCLAGLAMLRLDRGEVERAQELIASARHLLDTHQLWQLVPQALVINASAVLHAVAGELDEARADFLRALRQTSLMRGIAPWYAVAGRLQLARCALLLGDVVQARQLVAEASDLYQPSAEAPRLREQLQQAATLVEQGAGPIEYGEVITTAEMRVLQYLPTHLSFPEIGERLYLSRHTVKSHAMSTYRKLGAASRSQAVERARELGLIQD